MAGLAAASGVSAEVVPGQPDEEMAAAVAESLAFDPQVLSADPHKPYSAGVDEVEGNWGARFADLLVGERDHRRVFDFQMWTQPWKGHRVMLFQPECLGSGIQAKGA
jgi:hypothetical protein